MRVRQTAPAPHGCQNEEIVCYGLRLAANRLIGRLGPNEEPRQGRKDTVKGQRQLCNNLR